MMKKYHSRDMRACPRLWGGKQYPLRDYQKEAVKNVVAAFEDAKCVLGGGVVQLATGLGKTMLGAAIPYLRVLWVVPREELVWQIAKYYDPDEFEVEQGKYNATNTKRVVIGTVNSLYRRLKKYNRWDFDLIIFDECHHIRAKMYEEVRYYFLGHRLGLSATPVRSDGGSIWCSFPQGILYEKDLGWGIDNGYLANLEGVRVNVGYDLGKVRKQIDDYNLKDLEKEVNQNKINKAVAQAVEDFAIGRTLIFAATITHAENLQKVIPGSYIIHSKMKKQERLKLVSDFRSGKIKRLINCLIFTEGFDLPELETLVIARPTRSPVLYNQMIGRVVRKVEGKEKGRIIDCVGYNPGELQAFPSLLGHDYKEWCELIKENEIFSLKELDMTIRDKLCDIDSWIKSIEFSEDWYKKNRRKFKLYNLNFIKTPTNKLLLPTKQKIYEVRCPRWPGDEIFQKDINKIYEELKLDERYLWDRKIIKKWGKYSPTDKQIEYLKKNNLPYEGISKGMAMQLIALDIYRKKIGSKISRKGLQ